MLGWVWRKTLGYVVEWGRSRIREGITISDFFVKTVGGSDPPGICLTLKIHNGGPVPVAPNEVFFNIFFGGVQGVQVHGKLKHLPEASAPEVLKRGQDGSLSVTMIPDWRFWMRKDTNAHLRNSCLVLQTSWGMVTVPVDREASVVYSDSALAHVERLKAFLKS
jgi:hypothetical protein